jgi:hypothetical protein
LIREGNESEIGPDIEPEAEGEDEFAAIQNLSPADFKKVLSFSLKNAAEVAAATKAFALPKYSFLIRRRSSTFVMHCVTKCHKQL